MPSGDYGVGYAWAILFSMAVFWVCIAVVACIIGFGGGFTWLSLGRFAGGGMPVLCFLVMLLGVNLGIGWVVPGRSFSRPRERCGYVTGAEGHVCRVIERNLKIERLANPRKMGAYRRACCKQFGVRNDDLLGDYFQSGHLFAEFQGKLDSFQLGIFDQIDSCDASKGITSLFIYSGDNQPRQIREKALLKIKSKPDWQEDLFRTLERDGVDEAFRFLLSNDVGDKPQFAKGVYQGVLSQARLIREGGVKPSMPLK